ncbi:unnamed protein product [Euphydryas editha]|uniref:Uncharacterized protein n=1 Tax=Euphydryas editha TaxID=104508 RepID=A0AAU9TSX7_EUPED|nr:unnamed protein product [Euphydryas editha]
MLYIGNFKYSTAQNSTPQNSTAQHSATLCSAVQHIAVQCSKAQYSAVQRNTVQNSAAQLSKSQRSAAQLRKANQNNEHGARESGAGGAGGAAPARAAFHYTTVPLDSAGHTSTIRHSTPQSLAINNTLARPPRAFGPAAMLTPRAARPSLIILLRYLNTLRYYVR